MSAMVRVEITPELLRQCVDRNVHYSPECCTYAAFHITERFPDTWRTGCQLLESAVENFDSDPEFAFQRATQWGHDEFTQIEIDSYLLNETERRREPYSQHECERVAAYITEYLFVSGNGGWSLVSEALQATGSGDREENPTPVQDALTQEQWRSLSAFVLTYFNTLADELKAGTAKFERSEENVGLGRAATYARPEEMQQWMESSDGRHYLSKAVSHVIDHWIRVNLLHDQHDQFQQRGRERALFLREFYDRMGYGRSPFRTIEGAAKSSLIPLVKELLYAKGGLAGLRVQLIIAKAVERESRYLHAIFNVHD